MAKNTIIGSASLKCPLSGKACINCALYRGEHFNLCFQDHYRGKITKAPVRSKAWGYLAAARIVKYDQRETGRGWQTPSRKCQVSWLSGSSRFSPSGQPLAWGELRA